MELQIDYIMKNFQQSDEEIIGDLIEFIHDEILNAGSKGVVIGLSGGIDSAVVACLSVLAIGKDKVTLIHLPETELEITHTEDAKLTAEELGVQLRIIDISSIIDNIMKLLPDLDNNRLAKGNLKARIRAVILYTFANLENKLVLGTSNKSEISIGYGTKYGDLAADLWPIADIYKTELYRIAEKLKINKKIIEKPPTAGLWVNQTDEGEIGVSYQKLDCFLLGLEQKVGETALAEKLQLSEKLIQKIKSMINKGSHKQKMPKKYNIKRF
jgi:NAD+ synthase